MEQYDYQIVNEQIPTDISVKDLGVLFSSGLNFQQHILNVVKIALQRANLIYRCFSSKSVGFLVHAFKTYVRPLLEYSTVIWSPATVFLIDKIESIQRTFTRRIPGFARLNYVERTVAFDLEPLELRRIYFDLQLLHSMRYGHIDMGLNDYFTLSTRASGSRHSCRIINKSSKSDVLFYSFFRRAARYWNFLPDSITNLESAVSFQAALKKISFLKFLKGSAIKDIYF